MFLKKTVDVPMTRVKMNAKHEYEYIANFKVMQNVFKAKRIEKARLWPSSFSSHLGLPSQKNAAHPRRKAGQMQNAVRIFLSERHALLFHVHHLY